MNDIGDRDPRVQAHRRQFGQANGFAAITQWADHDPQWCGDVAVGAALGHWKFADPQWAGKVAVGQGAHPICPENTMWSDSAQACVPLGASLSGPVCSPGTYWDDWLKNFKYNLLLNDYALFKNKNLASSIAPLRPSHPKPCSSR